MYEVIPVSWPCWGVGGQESFGDGHRIWEIIQLMEEILHQSPIIDRFFFASQAVEIPQKSFVQ